MADIADSLATIVNKIIDQSADYSMNEYGRNQVIDNITPFYQDLICSALVNNKVTTPEDADEIILTANNMIEAYLIRIYPAV